ncbi:DNA-binding protein [Bradyrhizobium sp. CCBAU 51627]|uniref:DNA-binding protein n=1 Tax=Bradyrhizobium sp. CCBAU 51627 TaxID=1325088 RepID=UPI002306792C|nr:DNA-binding protein [Bradyrhizobium sp. CCBAU 51627]
MNDELKMLLSRPTASIPDVGRVCFGLARQASYAAAKNGDIPTIKVGRSLFVPTAALRKILGIEAVAS